MTASEVEQNGTLLRQPDPQLAIMAASSMTIPGFRDLVAVLFECFIIITLGYLSCRFKLISHQAKDLNSYLTTFALPMIIFLNIAQMEFQTINISFLACMLVSKVVVFIIVTVLTLTISYPRDFSYAGALSILATQSNDFALGYPLIKSLFGDTKPEMLTYLSLMAPIQLLILNPIGITMLEYQKYKQMRKHQADKSPISICKRCNLGISPTSSNQSNQNHFKSTIQSSPLGDITHSPTTILPAVTIPSTTNTIPKNFRLDNINAAEDDSSNDKNGNVVPTTGIKSRNRKMLMLTLPSVMGSGSEESLNNLDRSLNKDGPVYNDVSRASQVTRVLPANSRISPSPELNKSFSNRPTTPPINTTQCSCQTVSTPQRNPIINLNFIKVLLTNPLIIASAVALIVNLVNGPELPRFVTRFSSTIAASFASPALFVVGLSMYGKFELLLKHPNDLLLASSLVLTKVFILPNVMRTFALVILPRFTPASEIPYLVDFAFLYGLLPTAPGACIIANQYGVLSNVVSITMSLSTFVSAPMLVASAVIISPSDAISALDIEKLILQTLKAASLITMVLAPFCLYGFWKSNKKLKYADLINSPDLACRSAMSRFKTNPYHVFLLLLALSQTLVAFGGLLWFLMDLGKDNREMPPALRAISNIESDTASMDTISGRNLDSIINSESVGLMAPSTYPFPVPDPDTSNLVEPLESRIDQIHLSLNQKTLSMAYYVFASTGLMMVRFVALGLIVTIAALRLKGRVIALKVSTFMVKSYAVIGTAVVIGLTFESDKQKNLPIEAILPSSTESLIVRLVYNIIFLGVSLPCFALIIRADNKSKNILIKSRQSENLEHSIDSDVGGGIIRRRYLTSSASLSSDTSSALTVNTNLEHMSNGSHYPPTLYDVTTGQAMHHPGENLPTYLDGAGSDVAARSLESNIVGSNWNGPYARATSRVIDITDSAEVNRNCETYTRGSNENVSARCSDPFQLIEFNKYSILVVFMIFDSILSFSSITQKLLQDQPLGTFRQIEVIRVAMEFGQGLLTFLIYGMGGANGQ